MNLPSELGQAYEDARKTLALELGWKDVGVDKYGDFVAERDMTVTGDVDLYPFELAKVIDAFHTMHRVLEWVHGRDADTEQGTTP